MLHAKLLMVQREGKIVHVIVKKCFDFTKMLGKLVQREVDELPVLTLAWGDEKTAPYPSQNKRTQVREDAERKAFHEGRNFK